MSIFDGHFGKKKTASNPAAPAPSGPAADSSQDPNLIRVFDKYGRELFITKDEWRKSVLPGAIQSNWTNPDQLYGIIVGALQDGFRSDIVKAGQQLFKTDNQHVRAACIWGIVLMEEGRLEEAERVFQDHASKYGEDGTILTNLAKVFSKRKDETLAEQTLWHALEVDPNQENGLGWYGAIHRERGGDDAFLTAMRRVAAHPASWRAQMWLARAALASKDLSAAISLYQECLSRTAKPAPSDLLMQMSGDLGNAGYLREILQLIEPLFDAKIHGLQVGNNLMKAHLDLGQLDLARQLLNQLYALNRPDYRENLSFWDTELAKAKVADAPIEKEAELKMTLLAISGPVWLKPDSPAGELYPAKPGQGAVVCFLGSSTVRAVKPEHIKAQLADAPGRLSRALPLYLAEQMELSFPIRTHTLVPWIIEPTGGFLLSGVEWTLEQAVEYAKQSETKSDYVVLCNLTEQAERWTAKVQLIRAADGQRLCEISESFSIQSPGDAVDRLARKLLEESAAIAGSKPQPLPPNYTKPETAHLPNYLLRLEQLLATRCASLEGAPRAFLNGEREILDGNLQQCLAHPTSVSMRILFVQTLEAMKRVRPDIMPEFEERVKQLQKERPLPEVPQRLMQKIIDEVFAA